MSKFKITLEQADILEVSLDKNMILLIQALAGTGKTTTLIEIMKKNKSKSFLYLSFGEKIVKEIEAKAKKNGLTNVKAKTFHALAYQYVAPELIAKGQKLQIKFDTKFIEQIYGAKLKNFERYTLIKYFNKYCNQTLGFEEFQERILNLSKEEAYLEQVSENKSYLKVIFKYVEMLYNDMENFDAKNNTGIPFFTFGFYLKHFIDNIDKYNIETDVVLIDEAQDLNPVMLKSCLSFINKGTTLISVGDSNQSIYSFINNIDLLNTLENIIDTQQTELKIKVLTNSFRFGSNTKMEELSNLILGFRKDKTNLIKGVATFEDDKIKDTIYLGRSNSQVFWNAYHTSLNKQRYNLIGGISTEVKNLMLDVEHLANNRHDKIQNKIIKERENLQDLKEFAIANNDKEISSIITLIKNLKNLPHPDATKEQEKISLFSFFKVIEQGSLNEFAIKMQEEPIYFSTIHKAKGLEFDEVQLLPRINENNIMLLGFNKDFFRKEGNEEQVVVKLNPPEQIIEELNLLYVAFTRAKKSLSILNDEVNMNLKFLRNINKYSNITSISNFEMSAKNSAYIYPSNNFIKISMEESIFLVNLEEFEAYKKIISLSHLD